jgi:ABC-type nickel/cobalt efflux system permease component RcnA
MLLATAGAAALLHTLIPDHWLPFVLVGRARSWSGMTTAAVSGFSAVVHVVTSVALGLAALGIGMTAAEAIGETLHHVGAALLVLFGLAYALWAWRKGGHFHPGGNLLHRRGEEQPCTGQEGDSHPEHLHYHADGHLIGGHAGWSGFWLAVIVGANPCILVLPIMVATAGRGAPLFWLVVATYGAATAVLIVGLSVLGVAAGRRLRLPVAARYMEAASGLLIALLGLFFWFMH